MLCILCGAREQWILSIDPEGCDEVCWGEGGRRGARLPLVPPSG